MLAASRFAHYLKVMMRDKIGSFMTRGNVHRFLNVLGGYTASGVGRENHRMLLDHYSQTKCLLVSYSPEPLGLFYQRSIHLAFIMVLGTAVIAEVDGAVAFDLSHDRVAYVEGDTGLGALVVSRSELRACYVVPEAARSGVGTALVNEIERIAREHGLTHLQLESSINAEPFYRAVGYAVVERGDQCARRAGEDGELVCLEINTQPGMTETSLAPEQARHAGHSFEELVTWMVEDASCNR